MNTVTIDIKLGKLSARLFDTQKSEIVLIIASATGVKQNFYQKFAEFIASEGITVITFDYLGIGMSLNKPIKEHTHNAADWGANDLESVIQYVINTYPDSQKVILGHSIGGQLVGLARSSTQVDKIILVAAQSGYWKYWKGFGKVKMWFNWYVLFPAMLRAFGYMNSKKVSGMENLPKNVANQWRTWGKHRDYILSDKSIKHFYYDQIKTHITAFSIDDDEFAPKEAADWMAAQYQNAKKKSVHLIPSDFNTEKIGHFGVFKEKFRDSIWALFLKEML